MPANAVKMNPEKAAELIDSQFPELNVRTIKVLEGGWDNYVYLVNGKTVFRFTMREEFIPSMKAEIELLSCLNDFPVGLPCYEYVSESGHFFAGYSYIEGVPLHQVPGISEGITRDMVSIIQYLKTLDNTRVESSGIPVYSPDSWKRKQSSMLDSFRKKLSGHINQDVFTEAESQIDSLFAEIPESAFTLEHSDLYRGNVLAEPDNSGINAVIDWQEAAIGDIALDLAALSLDFGQEFTSMLAGKTLSPTDPEALKRARLYQKVEPFHILEHRFENSDMHDVDELVKRIEKSFLKKE